jgi:hypothetical protein
METLIFYGIVTLAILTLLRGLLPTRASRQETVYLSAPVQESRTNGGNPLLGMIIFGALVLLLMAAVPS